ncbi:unnamed protein product [Rotaria sp. Silwood1]|nr:unnamed protein product [Rotaria sp. Silwood1]
MTVSNSIDSFYTSLSDNENFETTTLIWLDSRLTELQENIRIQQELRSAINHIKDFDNIEECKNYIQHLSRDDRVVLITSGKVGKEFVPYIHDFRQITSIYIFCMDKKKNEIWPKAFIKYMMCIGSSRFTAFPKVNALQTPILNNTIIPTVEFWPPTKVWCPWRADSCTQVIPRPGQMTIVMDQSEPLGFEVYLSISDDPTNTSYAIYLAVTMQQIQISKIVDGLTLDINRTTEHDHVLHEGKDLYWLSLDYTTLLVKYGQGEVRHRCTLLQSSLSEVERNTVRQIQFAHVSFNGSRLLADYNWYEYKVKLKIGQYPVVLDPPLLVVEPDKAGLDVFLNNSAILLTRLEEPCRLLYYDTFGWKFQDDTFPYLFEAIERSIRHESGWCYKKLKEKSTRFGKSNPRATYLRVTVGMNRGTSPGVPYVLEIWPPGHYSPIHSHADTYGIIRVLYGEINVKLYRTLNVKRKKPFHEMTLYKDQVTWLSPGLNQIHKLENQSPNQTCITIQAYEYRNIEVHHYEYFDYINNDGFSINKFEPVSDMDYVEFRKIMITEWNNEL